MPDIPKDQPPPEPPIKAKLERAESFVERQNFADAESDAEDSPGTSSFSEIPRKVRRGSRTSRGNSLSDANARPNSASPINMESSDGDEETNSSTSLGDNSLLESRKRRKKRKRILDEGEKAFRQKVLDIDKNLCGSTDVMETLENLRELATSHYGLLDDDIRRRAWPRLVNIRLITSEILPDQKECEAHPEYNQVVLDVNRSLKRFPPGIKEEARPGLQDQLTRLIIRVLLKHPSLHYYQGYHDVAITFLLVVGEEMGYHIMQRISISHLKDFMAPTMEKTTHLLNYMYPIIFRESGELYDFLEASDVGTIFALPWMITWFGHVLPNYEDVVRLYDFFLAKPPLMPVYLATALVLHREQEILMTECDLAMVHGLLSRIPVDLPFEKLLVDACELYDQYPPNTIEREVQRRMTILKREQESHKIGKTRQISISTAIAVIAVTAPIAIGIFAWKYFNS